MYAIQPLILCLVPLAGSAEEESFQAEQARWRAHYQRVEDELAAKDVSHLSEAERAARAQALAWLRDYHTAGDFGRFPGVDGERLHLFVDDDGRRCAVAYLMDRSGENELVEDISDALNNAMVIELAADPTVGPPLSDWLTAHGLTAEEAARIQGPGVIIQPEGPPIAVEPWGGPGDTTGPTSPGPNVPTPGGGPTSPGPRGPGAPSGGGMPGATPATPTSGGPESSGAESDWSVWWEFNKLTWLVPNRVDRGNWPLTGDRSRAEDGVARLRRELEPLLRANLKHAEANVRAAAVVALARVAGPSAVEAILPLLDDSQEDVRRSAILALGATGSERAVHTLLRLAYNGGLAQRTELGAQTRWTAIVALGLARRGGTGDGVESMLPDPCLTSRGVDAERMQDAVLNFQVLAPTADLSDVVRDLSGAFPKTCAAKKKGSDHPKDGLPRALEALAFDPDEKSVQELLQKLGSRDLEERRSAALALGGVTHKLALGPLQTAFELEKEPLTRGFLLLSIGRRGGEGARDFLIHTYKRGPRTSRPWCALALGILARDNDDDEAREALRTMRVKQRSLEARAASLLASGLAQDQASIDELRYEVMNAGNDRIRGYAALGLALSGEAGARDLLSNALPREKGNFARSAVAQALGYLGDSRDAEVLAEELLTESHPNQQVQMAAALGFHGTLEAAERLVAALDTRELSDVARGAAIQSLGMLLDDDAPFALAALSRNANYMVFREWMNLPLQSTL